MRGIKVKVYCFTQSNLTKKVVRKARALYKQIKSNKTYHVCTRFTAINLKVN